MNPPMEDAGVAPEVDRGLPAPVYGAPPARDAGAGPVEADAEVDAEVEEADMSREPLPQPVYGAVPPRPPEE